MAKKTTPKKANVAKKAVKKAATKAVKKAVKKAAKKSASSAPAVKEEKIISREDDFSSREVSQVPYSPGNVQEEGNKRPAILFIIVVVFGIIAFLSYLNNKKKAETEGQGQAVVEEAKPEVKEEPKAEVAAGEWEAGLGGDKVTWESANKRCKGLDMRLPTAKELLGYRTSGPKETVDQLKEIKARTWTADENGNEAETVYMNSGNVGSRDKSKKYRSLCRK